MPRFENRTGPRWGRPDPSIPLRGFVFDETGDSIWMTWRLGTWNIRKSDIVAREPWEITTTTRRGVAEIVYVRIDALIRETDLCSDGAGLVEWP